MFGDLLNILTSFESSQILALLFSGIMHGLCVCYDSYHFEYCFFGDGATYKAFVDS